jgi:hypothetical protein
LPPVEELSLSIVELQAFCKGVLPEGIVEHHDFRLAHEFGQSVCRELVGPDKNLNRIQLKDLVFSSLDYKQRYQRRTTRWSGVQETLFPEARIEP